MLFSASETSSGDGPSALLFLRRNALYDTSYRVKILCDCVLSVRLPVFHSLLRVLGIWLQRCARPTTMQGCCTTISTRCFGTEDAWISFTDLLLTWMPMSKAWYAKHQELMLRPKQNPHVARIWLHPWLRGLLVRRTHKSV